MAHLKGILENGFQPGFCDEYSLSEFDATAMENNKRARNLTAMVCFCDLPLGLLKHHISFYGRFGIGLRKEWGLKQGIEPVIYSHPNGQRKNPFEQLLMNADSKNLAHVRLIRAFVKRWKGKQWRKNKYHNVDFYNEREWRYVPTFPDGSPIQISNEKWSEKPKANLENRNLKDHPLIFGADDIEYLIVPNDTYIMRLHRFLCRVYKGDEEGIVAATTAIMTADRIDADA